MLLTKKIISNRMPEELRGKGGARAVMVTCGDVVGADYLFCHGVSMEHIDNFTISGLSFRHQLGVGSCNTKSCTYSELLGKGIVAPPSAIVKSPVLILRYLPMTLNFIKDDIHKKYLFSFFGQNLRLTLACLTAHSFEREGHPGEFRFLCNMLLFSFSFL